MRRRHLPKFKALLIGFVLAKIVIALICLMCTLPLTDLLLWDHETAAAQDKSVEVKSEAAADAQVENKEAKQPAEIMALVNQLEDKRTQLKEQEEQIKTERAQLEQMKQDIDLKLEKMSAVQAQIDAALAKKAEIEAQEKQQQDAAEAAKVKQLVKVYSSMSPKKAAEIIDKLDMKVVYEVFSNMKGEEVGQILTYVSGDRAAEITERLADMSKN